MNKEAQDTLGYPDEKPRMVRARARQMMLGAKVRRRPPAAKE